MAASCFKAMIYTLLALCGVAACGDHKATHRFLRETPEMVDHGSRRVSDSQGRGGLIEGPGTFIVNGRNWTSEAQFVQGGGRCQTVRPTEAQRAKYENDLRNFRGSVNAGQRRRLRQAITINVNWVVISNNAGDGNLLQWQIDSQINILNAAFAPDFQFVATIRRETNNQLFTCTNFTEYEMSNNYGVRNRAVLNFFTCYPPGFLGWSRFPSGGIAGSVWDLAVVAYNSLPGGNMGPYSHGHVSADQCIHPGIETDLSSLVFCSFILCFLLYLGQ
jgi:hypothetical protein